MPKLDAALIAFGKLVGLMDSSGTVQWSWFANPLNNSLLDIPANRAMLGVLMRAILDRPDSNTNPVFDQANNLEWEPIKPIDSIGVGFIWNSKTNEPLHLGFGANASFDVAGQKLNLGLLARMLNLDNAVPHASAEFGQVLFSGSFPVPQFFLNGATLTGSYINQLALTLAVQNKANATKSMTMPPTTFLAWDSARIAAFIVRSWVAAKATENPADKGFFYRLDKHLFPMLGDPPNPISALPPLDATGQAPNFDAWKNSVFTTADGGTGALTFLWHLRALITGTETADLLSGSSYFPLIVQGGAPPTFPPNNFPVAGTYPPVPDQAGVWIGIRPGLGPNVGELVIDFRRGSPPDVASFVIARFNNGTLERPQAPAGGQFTAMTAVLGALLPINYGDNSITGASTVDGGYQVTIFSHTVNDPEAPPLNGDYKFSFVLHDGQPIQYRFDSPIFGLTLPPTNAADVAADLVTHLLQWMFNSVLSQPGHPLTASVNALMDLVKKAIAGGGTPSADSIIAAAAGIAGNAAKFEIGDVFKLDIAPNGGLKPTLEIGPIAPDALKDAGISIGKLTFGSTLALQTLANPISGFSVGIIDLRLGKGGGPGASGLVSQLFPDLREVQGFTINIDWKVGDSLPSVTGGGKIPIQRTIGPLEIVAILVEFETNSFTVGVDLFFALGPIQVVVYELGITINYSGTVSLFLHGLGLSFDGGGIKLTGMFLEVSQGPNKPSDYIGGAVVSVVNLFQLSAIGGYSTDSSGDASLFIFASLVAPLGGPPWFFITGIAGGFGFNRNLPSPELLGDHPFLKVMNGDLSFDPKNPQGSLLSLGTAFAVQHGQYWIAAGIQFTCFAVINGKVIVAVSFGKKFSFNLLGMLSYGIKPIAYFELDFMVTADEEHFLLIAGMSPNSYLIDPDIFSLQGQFCMGVWYASPHAGDFVISIGGYHPFFKRPDHYPDLTRVGVKAVVYNFIHVDVQCFFACTPQALMAGASVSLYGSFAGISAGLDVYIDVLIQWDPFFILARLGVTVWFEFMGRHEIGVDLQIHTPPFGGIATIKLFVVSFDISFGDDLPGQPAPPLYEFISSQLGVPATASGTKGASVAALNSASNAGLIHIDVTDGRTTKPPEDSKKQEGIDAPIPVNSEFRFTVKTKLPIGEPGAGATLSPPSTLNGETDLPLCEGMMNKASVFTITAPNVNSSEQTRMIDFYPAANFGDKLPTAQADDSARDVVGSIDTSKPSVPLSEGIEVNYKAVENPQNAGYLNATNEEFSSAQNKEEYPLPLAWPKPNQQIFRVTASATSFAVAPLKTKIKPAVKRQSSREMATALNSRRVFGPVHWTVTFAEIVRATVQVAPRSLTLNTIPQGAAAVNVPVSTVRRQELYPVNLRIAPVQAPMLLRLPLIPAITRSVHLSRVKSTLTDVIGQTTTPTPTPAPTPTPGTGIGPTGRVGIPTTGGKVTIPGGTTPPSTTPPSTTPPATTPPDMSILPRKAAHVEFTGGKSSDVHRLSTSGAGTLRLVFLGGGEEFLEDRFVPAGQATSTPPGTRDVLLLHQGTLPPVVSLTLPAAAPAIRQAIAESIGIEADTLTVALSARTFAGHGCVLQSGSPLRVSPNLFDMVSGAQLLESLTSFTVHFPMVQKGATLILVVEPNRAAPAPALDQVRWAALNATLDGLATVVGPDRTALMSSISAMGAWDLEVDLGPDWRISAVVVSPAATAATMDKLRQSNDWDMIDDRIQTGVRETAINVNLEVSK